MLVRCVVNLVQIATVTSDATTDGDDLYVDESIADDDGGIVRRADLKPSTATSPAELQLRAAGLKTGIITSQLPAPTELQYILPPRMGLAENTPYYYDSLSGINTFVFVVDLGWNRPVCLK